MATHALLLVDIQNDFCPGGTLAVPEAERILPVVNRWIDAAQRQGWPIVASRDWHPQEHCSFTGQGGPWPAHCVQDTQGAAFPTSLQLPDKAVRVSKGCAFDRDNYSAFDGTGLAVYLRRHGVQRLLVAGLALDVCVKATAEEALGQGFEVELLAEATRAVDPTHAADCLDALRRAGATIKE
ncbi:isochorismatase family protein [Modicisalibacter sp. 'Wilcox']|uniref:isochorismatase family protein n=1 Tax=Modicisalibacter sp. 'Wilcox' TaxID=2679914 RepID=UPI000792C6EC|nr:isochorismatase family protein [Modicisalibacter sp. 'Wilcox']KXS39364.1 MAG: nicotinamidase/pyrazinamidase [Halomonadaceae bacterium T82-2]